MAQGTPVKHKKKSKSVLKNIRQSERRAAVNRMNRTRVRTPVTPLPRKSSFHLRFRNWTRPSASARSTKTRQTATNRVSCWL